jgi:hypothetical protein
MNMDRKVKPLASAEGSSLIESEFVAAVDRSELREKPFDHIYVEGLFDPQSYWEMLAAMPDRRFYHELRHRDALRADGTSTRLRLYLYPELLWRLPPKQRRAWLPIARALLSRRLEDAFKRKFRSALEERFGKPVKKLGVYPVPILLRDQPGYKISIHSDVPTKAVTVQFYLPPDASQRNIGTIFHEGDKGAKAKKTTQMSFMPATGYAFPVSLTKSWHSAAETTDADGERVTMMVTYYVADDLAKRIKYRLRRAALWFGVHPER